VGAVRSMQPSWALKNRAANSASVAEATTTTTRMTLLFTLMAPLVGGGADAGVGLPVRLLRTNKPPAQDGSRFGVGQVGRVAVNVEDHVAGAEPDGCVGVSGGVVEELVGGMFGLFGGIGLGGGDGSEGG
jgi:hypothetical protein